MSLLACSPCMVWDGYSNSSWGLSWGLSEGCDGSRSGRRFWPSQALGSGWSPQGRTGWDGSGIWGLDSAYSATEELCSLGLGAMAEVGTIVDKVKEVLSQHAGF